MTYIAITEPNTNHLLLRLDAERAIIEIVRRRHKTLIDLTEYGLEYKAPQSAERIAMSDKTETTKFDAFMAEVRLLAGQYGVDGIDLVTTVKDETIELENGPAPFQAWPESETLLTVTKGQRTWKYILTRVDGSPFDLKAEVSP